MGDTYLRRKCARKKYGVGRWLCECNGNIRSDNQCSGIGCLEYYEHIGGTDSPAYKQLLAEIEEEEKGGKKHT